MRANAWVNGITGLMFGALAAAGSAFAAGSGENGSGGKVPEGYLGDNVRRVVTESSGDCVRTSTWSDTVPCSEPEQVAKAEPPPPPVAPTPKRVTLASKTLFDFDKATLRPEGKEALDQAIGEIRSDLASVSVDERHIAVTGHTDSTGTEAYNQRLSERRAAAVKAYLVAQGVDPGGIESRGAGESEPVASNATAEGQQQNRRVEIVFEATVQPKP